MSQEPGLRIVLGDWSALGLDAKALRFAVFVHEQKVAPDIELDDLDAFCLHAVAYDQSGAATGTARLLPDGHIVPERSPL